MLLKKKTLQFRCAWLVLSQGQGRECSQEDLLSKKIDYLAKSVVAFVTQVNGMVGHSDQQRQQVSALGRGWLNGNDLWSGSLLIHTNNSDKCLIALQRQDTQDVCVRGSRAFYSGNHTQVFD